MKRLGKQLILKDGSVIPIAQAIDCGDYVYVSGHVAFDESMNITGSVGEQTLKILTILENLLKEASLDRKNIIKCTCWLMNKNDFPEFNAAFKKFFGQDLPARSTVRSEILVDAKLEIEAIAYRKIN